jgi:AraC-like DNA-binding protein
MIMLCGGLFAQQNTPTYIKEYYRLVYANRDSALVLCDQLIKTNAPNEKAFGYAGKAHLFALKSAFEKADELYQEADLIMENITSEEKGNLEKYVQYFKALRLIETHELVEAVEILNDILLYCNEDCSIFLKSGVQSALARSYSLSKRGIDALRITRDVLVSLKEHSEFPQVEVLEFKYTTELFNAAFRSITLFISDNERYKDYLDSAQRYAQLAEQFIEQNDIKGQSGKVLMINSDINFRAGNFEQAKFYYEQALGFYQEEGFKKRVEQILFRLGECYFELKDYQRAEKIFTRQLEENVWPEYQLLKNEAQCHYYLIKIYREYGDSERVYDNITALFKKQESHYEEKNESELKLNDLLHSEERAREMEGLREEFSRQNLQENILTGLLLLFTVITIIYYIIANKKKRENIRNLNQRIEELQRSVSKSNSIKNSSLTDENAQRLLEKLKGLEEEELYLRPDYSLNLIARILGTNTSYLSKTVNAYMGISFAEYSNRLKINGIVNKLEKHRYYRNYTIDALAKEAGYRSVNSYNTNFKKILKITPSQYLKELDRNQEPGGGGGGGSVITHSQISKGTHT